MGESIIQVESVSKRYRIGIRTKAKTFAEQVKNGLLYPVNNLKKIASLKKFDGKDDPSVFWALQNIDFEVERGEVLGIIGHNGAGKSTLLKILSKITEPTSGQITIKGRVSSLLEVGTGFHPELTGRDNVYMNGTILGMTKREINKKFDEIIAFAGIEKHIETPVKFYSSGMKVRLGFSVAAHLEPEVLVIDEVLAVGDLGFQKKCLGKMDEVSKSGRTVLFVSHNMASVEALCSRCLLLDKGRIVFDGNVNETVDKYRKQTYDLADVSLENRSDRQGNGELQFTGVQFNKGEPVTTGDQVTLRVNFRATKAFKDIQIALTLCRNFEDRVMVIDTRSQGVELSVEKGEGVIEIVLPRLYLLPRSYVINFWAADGKDVLDYVFSGAKLEVQDADVYGTGNMLNANKHGVLFVDKCTWEINKK